VQAIHALIAGIVDDVRRDGSLAADADPTPSSTSCSR
jgi:hypothetical protein